MRGEPTYAPIPNTNLLYVTNSDSDIFMDTKTQQYYTVLAGRWYRAKALEGTWEWVPGAQVPPDFARISPESPKGHVLASIPGTEQARESVIANEIPQTATVRRSEATLKVAYGGPPRFEPIEGTPMEYAVNTSSEVIHAEGQYYAVEHGIWFVADSPLGPWAVADMIPAVIYTIPPSSPLYHSRYVRVYGADPEYVYEGYTPGYLGAFDYDGVVVFGTGWWYPGMMCGDFWCGWPWTWGSGLISAIGAAGGSGIRSVSIGGITARLTRTGFSPSIGTRIGAQLNKHRLTKHGFAATWTPTVIGPATRWSRAISSSAARVKARPDGRIYMPAGTGRFISIGTTAGISRAGRATGRECLRLPACSSIWSSSATRERLASPASRSSRTAASRRESRERWRLRGCRLRLPRQDLRADPDAANGNGFRAAGWLCERSCPAVLFFAEKRIPTHKLGALAQARTGRRGESKLTNGVGFGPRIAPPRS